MRFWTRLVVASLACSAVAAEAQVISSARARLQGSTFEIYDAIPGDGIAAQAWFLDPSNAWRTSLYAEVYRDNDQSLRSYFADGYQELAYRDATHYAPAQTLLSPVVDSVGIFADEGFGGATGAWTSATPLLGAQGQSLAPGMSFSSFTGLSATATAGLSPTFYNLILGAGTGVRIAGYGLAEVWLSTDGAWANAYVELMAQFSPRAGDGSFQSFAATRRIDYVHADIDQGAYEFQMPHDTLVKRENGRQLSLSYENLSNADQIGRVRFATYADGEALAPVPEPHATWLLLAGLPLLGWVAKRRRT